MDIKEFVKEQKIVAIVRGVSADRIVPAVKALYDGGIRLVEVTFNQKSPTCIEDTAAAISAISKEFTDLYAGAGTVMTVEQVEAAYNAGAKYIISPDVNADVIKRTKELGMLSMPGALTPTEIATAHRLGADFVKLFPSGNFGIAYIKAIRAPLSHVPLLAVGGVDENNMADFYKAGICGFGIGSNLVNNKLIEAGDYEGLKALAEKYVAVASAL